MAESELVPSALAGSVLGVSTDNERLAVPLSHYTWLLRRHAWKIIIFVAVCVTATYALSKRLTPIYESTAVVDVDWQAPSAVVGQEASRNGAPSDAEQFLATQIRLVQSDVVLRPVAEKYHLLNQEHQIQAEESPGAHRVFQAPINLVRLTVTRPVNTYLLTISYRSPDPQQAADVANGIAQSYLETAYMLRLRSSSNLASFMEQQLDGLKNKMNASSQALAGLERELNVLNPEDKTNILSARLLQLNAEYTNAEADRVRKESVLKLTESGSIASVEAESLNQIRQRLDDARRRFALVKTTYGSTHPEYKKAESEIIELRSQLDEKQKSIVDQDRADYEQARSRELMLARTVADTKAEYDQLNARSFQYQERKREADTDKQLYEELTTKIKEAGINSGFQSNVIRIADYARPAAAPISPMVLMNMVLAFLFSAVAAVTVVVVRDAMDNTVRDPNKLQRCLGVDVIGALPAVSRMTDNDVLGALQPRLTLQGRPALLTRTERGRRQGDRQTGPYSTLSVYAEAIRTLRSTIILSDFDCNLRTILVTSAASGEGKTTTAINLAIAHAGQGSKTLIVDADLRRPSVHRRLGIEETVGLSEVLTQDIPWRQTVRRIEGIPELHVISAGQPSHRAADVIGPRMGDLFEELAAEFDLAIIDAPSLRGFADPLQMATIADGVLIVSEAGVTGLDAVSHAVSMLARVRANVIGIVLNRVRSDASSGSEKYVPYSRPAAL
jgi:capsular exopolysaccharide synthesis family protein